jgi:hypothetical protein
MAQVVEHLPLEQVWDPEFKPSTIKKKKQN